MNRTMMLSRSVAGSTVKLLLATLVCAAATTAAAAPPASSEGLAAAVWPMLGSAPTHSSLSGFQGPDTNQLAWRFDTNAGIDGGVAIDADGSVFFGSANGRFFALDQTGTERWHRDGLSPVVGVPALARGDKIYVAANGGKLHALAVATGASLWLFQARGEITTSPAIGIDGNVYVGVRSAGLVAVSPQGKLVWNTRAATSEGSSPAVAPDGTIYVATSDSRVVALAPDGSVLWQRSFGGKSGATLGGPTIRDDRLYLGAADGSVRALDRSSGAVLWVFAVGGAVGSGVSLGPDRTIHLATTDGKVYALRDTGSAAQLRWMATLGGKVLSTPAVDRTGDVFVGSNDRRVYALDSSDGSVRWTFVTGGNVRSAIAIGVGGRVFAGSDDRSLYAIGEFRSGADCWSDAFIDATGLTPDEVTRRVQILLAACGGPTVDVCEALVEGGVGADRYIAAQQIAAQQIDPAHYLALLRDRTRKLDALLASRKFCDVSGKDADGDYVPDPLDACPDTPPLTPTHDDGCTDTTLPDAPSADLVRDGLAKMNLLLDPRCDQTVPNIPAITFTAIGGILGGPRTKEIWFAAPDNQAPGCGLIYEMEVFYQAPSGAIETYTLVMPRARGVVEGSLTVSFTFNGTDAGTYGAFARSKAFQTINNAGAITRYRLRSTNYAGVRSPWGPLICDSCQTQQ